MNYEEAAYRLSNESNEESISIENEGPGSPIKSQREKMVEAFTMGAQALRDNAKLAQERDEARADAEKWRGRWENLRKFLAHRPLGGYS